MNRYQTLISELTPLNPAGVEASMRIAHDDLRALPRAVFVHEVAIAASVERDRPGYLASCAETMGLATDFAVWEAQSERKRRHVMTMARELRSSPLRALLGALVGAGA